MEQKTRRKARAHGTNKKLDDMRDFYEQFRAMPKEEQMWFKNNQCPPQWSYTMFI